MADSTASAARLPRGGTVLTTRRERPLTLWSCARPGRSALELAFGQVVWMGETSRLESVLVDGQEILARTVDHV